MSIPGTYSVITIHNTWSLSIDFRMRQPRSRPWQCLIANQRVVCIYRTSESFINIRIQTEYSVEQSIKNKHDLMIAVYTPYVQCIF